MGFAVAGDRRLQAFEVQGLCASEQFHPVRFTSNTATQSKPRIVRAQLVLCVGGLDRTGSPELVRDPACHQESCFGVARPACGSGLIANENE